MDSRTTERTAEQHSEIVLAGFLPSDRRRLDLAARYITPEHIPEPALRNLYVICSRYFEQIGTIPSADALTDMLANEADSGTVAYYKALYERLCSTEVEDGDYRWSIQQLREILAEDHTGTALAEALTVLRSGKQIGRETLSGHTDARQFIMQQLAEIEAALQLQDAPEGDIRHEHVEVIEEYNTAKAQQVLGRKTGVMTGIQELDDVTGGLQNGELDLMVGYSSEGKTGLCVQIAWHAATQQGLNVFFATSETLRPQVRRKIIARHSCEPQFGLPDGLNTRDLKNGTLTEPQEQALRNIVEDLHSESSYGKLYVAQIPRGSTISTLEARLLRANSMWGIDLVVIDYLALIRPDRPRQSQNQEHSDTIKSAKQLASTFDDGRGVPVLSPWQVSRDAWKAAQQSGGYTMAALSETSEAEKSSDLIVSLLRPLDAASARRAEVKVQILKNRDGERLDGSPVEVDYATCRYHSLASVSPTSDLLGIDDEGLEYSDSTDMMGLL